MNLKDYPIIEDEKGNNEENEEVMVDEVKIFEIFKLSHEIETIESITNHEVIKNIMDNKNEMIKIVELTMNE